MVLWAAGVELGVSRWVTVLTIVTIEVGSLTVRVTVGTVIVEVYSVGVADIVVVFSIVLVTEMVSVTLSIDVEDVLVAAHPPSTPTTEYGWRGDSFRFTDRSI